MSTSRGHRGRRVLLWSIVAVVVASGAGASWWLTNGKSAAAPPERPIGPPATAKVTRATIASNQNWNGILGHPDPFVVGAAGPGKITGIRGDGARVRRGTELYRLEEQPVIALLGRIPMYRDLGSGDTGADVEQLERNLAKLGYDGGYPDSFTVDDEYDWYTTQVVEEWQAHIGAEETGTVRETSVVFVPETGRVDERHVRLGDEVAPGADVLDITDASQVASIEVEVADRDLVELGTEVTVRVPGDVRVPGTVSSATVVQDDSGGDGADGGDGDEDAGAEESITQVEVTLRKRVDAALVGAPVDVRVRVDSREDVLVVPIGALLALTEGGFGLEVVSDSGATSIVPVEAGLFTDGRVEVSGDGIREGTVVGVAGR